MYGFKKSERITSLKQINRLFERGQNSSAQAFPLRAVYRIYNVDEITPKNSAEKSIDSENNATDAALSSAMTNAEAINAAIVLVSVAKKNLHHATDRNRAKRQIREAYRTQHHNLTTTAHHLSKQLDIAFIWLADKPMDSAIVKAAMHKLLSSINDQLHKRHRNATTHLPAHKGNISENN